MGGGRGGGGCQGWKYLSATATEASPGVKWHLCTARRSSECLPSERNILQNKIIKTISLITITIAKHWSKLNIWKVAQNYKIMESTLPQVRNVLNKISAIKNLSSLYRGLLLHSDSITDSDGSYIWHSIFSLNTDLVKDTGLLLLPLRIVKHDRFN